ncbi:MAG: universal stress protein [Halobacteriaceae archaeon]
MTFLVPYDGSYLAEAALTSAAEFGDALGEDVTAVTVVPDDERYAREKEWYGDDKAESFSVPYVVGKLHREVANFAPRAAFRFEEVEVAASAAIAERIEQVVDECYPSVVFLGTDDMGEVTRPLTSVAGGVAADAEYDVHVVRHFSPTAIQEIAHETERYPEA